MASFPVLQIAGLHTSDNPHSAVPPGSLVKAENAVMRYRNRIGPRRGQGYYEHTAGTATTFGSGSSRSNEGAFFGGSIVHHYGASTLARVVSGVGNTDYSGSYTPVDAAALRMKFVEAAQNLYFNTTLGNYLLESLTSTPAKAGLPRGLAAFNSDSAHKISYSATGWMATNVAAAYRGVFGTKDANGNVKLGPPSEKILVINRVDVPSASVSRIANVVTVTSAYRTGFILGDVVTLLNPTGTFGAGPHTITGVAGTSFTYNEVAANATSAVEFQYSSTSNGRLLIPLPVDASVSHFFRLSRTVETQTGDDDPGEEMYLVKEVQVTSTDLSNGYLDITDRTPSSQLGPPLYTNPKDGDGDTAAKFPPPVGKDMCLWDGRMWCFNTTDKHRFYLTLLGYGSPDGIQNGDTVTVAGKTFTAVIGGYAGSAYDFGIPAAALTGTLLPSQIVELAARSLVEAINYHSTRISTVTMNVVAVYLGGDAGPGAILIEESAVGGSTYYVGASRVASWAGVVPASRTIAAAALVRAGSTVTATTGSAHGFTTGQSVRLNANTADANFAVGTKTITVTGATTFTYTEAGAAVASAQAYVAHAITSASVNDRRQHGAAYSDKDEPEAFQINSWLPVGPKGIDILRVIPFRDKMFAFSSNRKVYSITGPAPYRVDELDGSALLIAPDSVKVHSNQAFALTDQGLGILTDSGFRITSRGIEDEVLDVLALTPATVSRYAFGVSYEADRQYQLWVPTSNGATSCGVGYIYNSMEDRWTKWTASRTWGGVSPVDGKLYMGDGATNKLRQERKTLDRTDFADETLAVTISSFSFINSTVTLVSASGVAIGDLLYVASDGFYSLITNVVGNVVTVVSTSGLALGTVGTVYKAFTVDLKYAPVAPSGLSKETHFQECALHFGEFFAKAFRATFDSNLDLTESTALLTAATSWTASGTPAAAALGMRNRYSEVPQEHAQCTALRVGLRITEAWASWLFDGFTLEAEPGGRPAP